MGCAQSKIDNEESVSRCKERRNLMKEAVSVRNAFASAQSGYAVSLKNTGAALSDYGAGEVPPPPPAMAVGPGEPSVAERPPPPPPHSMVESSLPPPPPPLPRFSPLPPIQRSMTMPAVLSHSENMKRKMKGIAIDESDEEEEEEEEKGGLNRKKKGVEEVGPETPIRTPNPPPPPGVAWDYFFMGNNIPGQSLDEVEEEEDDEHYMEGQGHENGNFNNVGDNNMEFKTPEKNVGFPGAEEFKTPGETPVTEEKEKQFVHSNTAPPGMSGGGIGGGGNMVGQSSSNVDLSKILGEIDDHFLKASQSAQEVSKMLEATRLHYHSNFADNRGHIDHAARVMQVITWNKSFKGAPNGDGTKDNLDADDYETHATVLDKLLAWEKKLYEEVKAGELMKLEYQRKVSALNKLKKRNASPEQLEKAKAAVSHLHTRYIVDWQSLDSTVIEVNDIRDKQLYPKLVALVHGEALGVAVVKRNDEEDNEENWGRREFSAWSERETQECAPDSKVVMGRAHRGLYAGRHIQFGNSVSEDGGNKTRRNWKPNVQEKRLFSYILDRHVRVKATTHAFQCIDKAGGIDEYLLKTPYYKMDTEMGLFWKAKIEKMYEKLGEMEVVFFTPEDEDRLEEQFREIKLAERAACRDARRKMYGWSGRKDGVADAEGAHEETSGSEEGSLRADIHEQMVANA
ncbi:unnamed protein product [Fraxinus pennsylvanica]|uniref:Large ribosomal subunit protein bL28m n=1 Tax=Fraxinus pennsylvanica TaxID=56036 RepID=A0AAD2E0A5_9LAMI|nr:unnamed protein product [Fraxinus pennsylvanica]